jgi:hypothetical protein
MGRNRSNATAAAVKGNLVAGTGVDTSGLLTVGANDTVLTADSAEATGMKWAAASAGAVFSGVKLEAFNDILLPNNTNTIINWNTEVIDTNAYHSTSTNTSRITIPTGIEGKFLIRGAATIDQQASGFLELSILKNGTLFINIFAFGIYVRPYGEVNRIITAVPTDYFQVRLRSSTGSNFNGTSSIIGSNEFSLTYLGA